VGIVGDAGDAEASLLQVIAPAGFEKYFEEVAAVLARSFPTRKITPIAARYGLELG
jgi:hypothetical protein